jgi:hypothetical protein
MREANRRYKNHCIAERKFPNRELDLKIAVGSSTSPLSNS